MDYVVEAVNHLNGIVLYRETYDNSNTAYHEYRLVSDRYCFDDTVTVTLIEPEF